MRANSKAFFAIWILYLATLPLKTSTQAIRNRYKGYYRARMSRPTTTTVQTTTVEVTTPERNANRSWAWTQLTEPLTDEQCRFEPYMSLRACRLSAAEANNVTKNYLCSAINRFSGIEKQIKSTVRREKRTININPCEGTRQRIAVLAATDSDGFLRELLVDRDNFLYQTIIRQNCDSLASEAFTGLWCQEQSITFEAAVYAIDQNSNEVFLEDVSTPAFCALTQV